MVTGDRQRGPTERSLTRRTVAGLTWTSSGTVLQGLAQVAVLALLARLLLPEQFGLVGAALVVIGLSDIFSQLGVGPAIVQRRQLEEGHVRAGFALSLAFGTLLAACVWLAAPRVADFFRMPELAPILRVLAVIFPLRSLSVVAESLAQRDLRFRALAGVGLGAYLIGFAGFAITAAVLGAGVWALVGAHLAQALVRSTGLLAIRPHPAWPRFGRRHATDLLFFGGGITATRLCNYLAVQGDNLVVGRFLGADALGLYGRAYQLIVVPANAFEQVASQVLFPAMAEIQAEPERLAAAYRRAVGLTALVVVPASAALFVAAPEIVHLLLGPDWRGVITPLRILTLGMFFRTGYKLADVLAFSQGAVYDLAWRKAVYAALVIGGAWLAQPLGIAGVALAVVVALMAIYVLSAQLNLRLVRLDWRSFLAAHTPALVLGGIVWAVATLSAAATRHYDWPAPAVLAAIASVTALTLLVFLRIAPELARDVVWLLRSLPKRRS